jgi:peptide/nickel transport system substrate-binding protein
LTSVSLLFTYQQEISMKSHSKFALALLAYSVAATFSVAQAATLRIANQGDALSMDPHSLNESLQLTIVSNVYEALVTRGADYKLAPGLATDWKQTAPTVWRFNLRKGVQFHDGTPFNADDVIFSYERAKGEGSDMKTYVGQIKEIKRLDDHTIDVVTNNPFPILPDLFTGWMMMSKKWCEANGATKPVDRRKGVENTASFKANGTGPYRLRERQPDVRSTFVRNANYWGKVDGNVDEVVFSKIGNDSTRVAALLSGEVDVMEPVPVQDVARLKANPGLQVLQGPELRVIFLGMDQKRDELQYSNVKGKNPFKDVRVRKAFYQAIDIDTIKKQVMRDAATPAALLIPPQVRGFAPELAKRLPYDLDAAKRLLTEAGYPNGFEVKMNCPNDRYVNDAEICQAVAANLAKVGVKIQLEAETKGTYFPKVLRRDTSFYMLGWTSSTVDAHNMLYPILSSPGEGGRGQFNLGAYSNARIDELTAKIASETDEGKRNAMIAEAMKIHQDEVGHLPLHQQALNWAAKKSVTLVQLPGNEMPWKFIKVAK